MTETRLKKDLDLVRQRLFAAISGVGEDQFKRRPPKNGADEPPWSIAEVLAHLLHAERIRADRLRAALDEDGVAVEAVAPEASAAAARAGRAAPVPQLVHGLLASRRAIELLLEAAEAVQGGLDRAVIHPRLGRQTIEAMVRTFVVDHEAEHAAQIEALRASVAAPQEARP